MFKKEDIIFCTFLRASAMLMHVLGTGFLSVRPSVYTLVLYQTAEHIVMLSSPHDSQFILVLCVYKIFAKFRRGHPLRGANSGGATPGRARSNALAKKLLLWLVPWLTEISINAINIVHKN